MQQSNTQQPVAQPKRAMLGFAFSLAGAILILLRGIVRIVVGDVITFAGSDVIRHRFLCWNSIKYTRWNRCLIRCSHSGWSILRL